MTFLRGRNAPSCKSGRRNHLHFQACAPFFLNSQHVKNPDLFLPWRDHNGQAAAGQPDAVRRNGKDPQFRQEFKRLNAVPHTDGFPVVCHLLLDFLPGGGKLAGFPLPHLRRGQGRQNHAQHGGQGNQQFLHDREAEGSCLSNAFWNFSRACMAWHDAFRSMESVRPQ